ncbi:hypothetical protein FH972_008225 [Carpinus fangiana]|uniref:DUF1442 domain-containing protein n=1 Tax=Carpinus fangiana TaxID=176857 RepID=A0A5N6QY05_9ROSI|nr:hypothetical protein FH972_008225 [Carpinus fangiana]
MACWSAENATKAYLKTLKMGQKAREPDVAEFISALAAGSNAQLIVVACAGAADSTTLALAAAAYQTGGRVVCILRGLEELRLSGEVLGAVDASNVEFVTGEARKLVLTQCREADFVLIDCNLENHEGIFKAVQAVRKQSGVVVVGYNAFSKESWWCSGARTQLLPIGEGLLVTRIARTAKIGGAGCGIGKSHWVVKVDKFTGEEHVFRVRFPQAKQIEA